MAKLLDWLGKLLFRRDIIAIQKETIASQNRQIGHLRNVIEAQNELCAIKDERIESCQSFEKLLQQELERHENIEVALAGVVSAAESLLHAENANDKAKREEVLRQQIEHVKRFLLHVLNGGHSDVL